MTDEKRQANIRALIGMLDETDPELYERLKQALFALGEEAEPYLEEAGEMRRDALWQNRIERLKRELQVNIACTGLTAWKAEPEPDLMRGFYLLSKAFCPNLRWEIVESEFNRLHGDSWMLLDSSTGLRESLAKYNNFFFNFCKFRLGQRITNGYGLSDFLLPNIINLKQGNERSLSLVYQYMASRIRIPVFLFNLPVVNLLACTPDLSLKSKEDVRYCIDITQNGLTVNRSDIEPVFSSQRIIRICNNVEAIQDYAKLMFMLISLHEQDEFVKDTARRVHLCLGSNDTEQGICK